MTAVVGISLKLSAVSLNPLSNSRPVSEHLKKIFPTSVPMFRRQIAARLYALLIPPARKHAGSLRTVPIRSKAQRISRRSKRAPPVRSAFRYFRCGARVSEECDAVQCECCITALFVKALRRATAMKSAHHYQLVGIGDHRRDELRRTRHAITNKWRRCSIRANSSANQNTRRDLRHRQALITVASEY